MPEPAQSIPMWQTVVGLLGLGSLIATGLSHWLSSRLDRKKWINDNKKLEWRELIDELDEGFEQMSYYFYPHNVVSAGNDRNNPMAGVQRGNRALTGRIFIADALTKNKTMDAWIIIVDYALSFEPRNVPTQDEQAQALADFNMKVNQFRAELLRVAQEDLDIEHGNQS
jgi:hypothetical protein